MESAAEIRSRRRLTLTMVVLATIPCYCLGWIMLAAAPERGSQTPTPFPVGPSETWTPPADITLTPSLTNTPVGLTLTLFPVITSSPTTSPTPFLPPTLTNTPTATWTFSPTPTFTFTFTPTATFTITPSPTNTATATVTVSPTATATATATSTPSPSPTASPTPTTPSP